MATVVATLWMLVVLQVLWFMRELTERLDPEPWGRAFVPTVLCAAGVLAYDTLGVARNGGVTAGRDVCAVRVVGPDGKPPTLARATLRAVPAAVVVVAPFGWWQLLAVAVYVAPLVLPTRATLADRVAGTTVVTFVRDRTDPRERRPKFAPRHRLLAMPSRLGEEDPR